MECDPIWTSTSTAVHQVGDVAEWLKATVC